MSIPKELTACFDPAILEFNQQGFVYIKVQDFIERLNSSGARWGSSTQQSSVQLSPTTTDKGKAQWVAHATVDLTIWDADDDEFYTRTGWGADQNFDPNTAMKTAGAEAFKKACNQFGIGFYLLGKKNPERTVHELHNKYLLTGNFQKLKEAVTQAARVDGVTPLDGEGIKKFYSDKFNVSIKSLEDADTLDNLLRMRF